MGFGSIWPWLIVLLVVLLLFGRGKISGLMGDVAHGVKSFRRGLSDDDAPAAPQVTETTAATAPAADADKRTKSSA